MKQIRTVGKLVKISDDDIWDEHVDLSLESNPFLTSRFLRSIGQENSRFALFESQQFIAGACIFNYRGGNFEAAHSFCLYQGLFFPNSSKKSYSEENLRLKKMQRMIASIDSLQRPIRLSMHFNINDLRGIDWYYFQNNQSSLQAKTKVKYTGVIQLQEYGNFEEYLSTIRRERMREFLRSSESDTRIEIESKDVESFMVLYQKTFARQGLVNSKDNLNRVFRIIQDGINQSYGNLSMLYSSFGEPISGVFILSDNRTDTYLFGANDTKYRNIHGSTRLLVEAVRKSYSDKKEIFDFCGMNSPQRGEFKSSFNALITPYFEVDLDARKEG